jgi:hypothetical protein
MTPQKSPSSPSNWYVFIPIAAIALGLAYWGFSVCADCHVVTPVDKMLRSFSLVRGGASYSHPWQLAIAQWLVPGIALFGAAKLLLLHIRRDMRVALARRSRGHVIVSGLGETGRTIALGQRAARQHVVAIESDIACENSMPVELAGVPVLQGSAADVHLLKLAGLLKATTLVVSCGSDSVNLEIALRARDACAARPTGKPLRILCEVRDAWLLHAIAGYTTSLSTDKAEFIVVNFYESAARALLNGWSARRKLLPSSAAKPRLVMVGLGKMGLEILIQAVQGYFAIPGTKLSVAIADKNIAAASAAIKRQWPALFDLADLSFHEHEFGPADDREFISGLLSEGTPDAVVITTGQDTINIEAALDFRRQSDLAGLYNVPVYARAQKRPELGAFIEKTEKRRPSSDRFVTFGSGGLMANPELLLDNPVDRLARATHETYARAHGNSQSWDTLPERMKRSNRLFADHVAVKLARFGLDIGEAGAGAALREDEIEILAQMEHGRWCVEQRLLGWQYGAVRDDLIRRHPLLVEWDALGEDAWQTNRDLVRSIADILAAAGKSVRRNRIVSGTETNLQTAPGENLVLLAEPANAEAARLAAQASGAHVWAVLHSGTTPAQMEAAENALGGTFQVWIDARAVADRAV